MSFSSLTLSHIFPDFVEIQRKSFLDLLDKGLINELYKRNPITSTYVKEASELRFYPEYYKLNPPDWTPKECILKSKSYACRLYIPIHLINKTTKESKLQWVLLGNLPLMTKRGHFILNGSPRVIVNQMVRSPGIYYQQVIHKNKIRTHYADLISHRGAWLRLETDKKARIWVRMKKTEKFSILVLLQALGLSLDKIFSSINYSDFLQESFLDDDHDFEHPTSIEEALEVISFETHPKKEVNVERAHKFLMRKFFNSRTYDLSLLGRIQLNKRLGLSIPLTRSVLTKEDILFATDYLIKLAYGQGTLDDIDDLKNKRVRASGELIQNQLGTGFIRLEKMIAEKLHKPLITVRNLITTKPVNGALREFFGSSPLSQFMDQTNPLAELTHKRRLSSLGPGGVSRETAGMAVRGIHPSHYGRICPIETPEGPNAGLVNSLTTYAKINSQGFLETPFYSVYKGQIQTSAGPTFFSAAQEEHVKRAPGDLKLSQLDFLPKSTIPVRIVNEFKRISRNQVEYISISPIQMISIATSLIPFLEHDDANRALMGSNMQRQAVPLIAPERPIVGTGLEGRVVADSGHAIQARTSGFVSYVSGERITIKNVIKPGGALAAPHLSNAQRSWKHPTPPLRGGARANLDFVSRPYSAFLPCPVGQQRQGDEALASPHLYNKLRTPQGAEKNSVSKLTLAVAAYRVGFPLRKASLGRRLLHLDNGGKATGFLPRFPGAGAKVNSHVELALFNQKKFNSSQITQEKPEALNPGRSPGISPLPLPLIPLGMGSKLREVVKFRKQLRPFTLESLNKRQNKLHAIDGRDGAMALPYLQLKKLSILNSFFSCNFSLTRKMGCDIKKLKFYTQNKTKAFSFSFEYKMFKLEQENERVFKGRLPFPSKMFQFRVNSEDPNFRNPNTPRSNFVWRPQLGPCPTPIYTINGEPKGWDWERALDLTCSYTKKSLLILIRKRLLEFQFTSIFNWYHFLFHHLIDHSLSSPAGNDKGGSRTPDFQFMEDPALYEAQRLENKEGFIKGRRQDGKGRTTLKNPPVSLRPGGTGQGPLMNPSYLYNNTHFKGHWKCNLKFKFDELQGWNRAYKASKFSFLTFPSTQGSGTRLAESPSEFVLRQNNVEKAGAKFNYKVLGQVSLLDYFSISNLKPGALDPALRWFNFQRTTQTLYVEANKGLTKASSLLEIKIRLSKAFSSISKTDFLFNQRSELANRFPIPVTLPSTARAEKWKTTNSSIHYPAPIYTINGEAEGRGKGQSENSSTVAPPRGGWDLISRTNEGDGALAPLPQDKVRTRDMDKGLPGFLPCIPGAGFNVEKNFSLSSINYFLDGYQRSNQDTCVTQRPIVREGDWIKKGGLLADGTSSVGGELALGKTILVAYMPWEGYNFEDAILISERLISDDMYTSIHIERYEIEIRDTKFGVEQITKKIPNQLPRLNKHLDNRGVVKIGSWVKEGDILVGKITPSPKKSLSPHDKLLYDIVKKTLPPTRDTSLRVPKNVHGRVVNVQILETENIPPEIGFEGPGRVRVYVAEKRKIQVGDKMAGRHGNKGIISTILPRQEMPYLPDGTPVDMVLNPLGVPSRMNVGQVFECLLGLAGKQLQQQFKIIPFDEIHGPEASRSLVYSKLFEARMKTGQKWLFDPNFAGKTKLFDGRTGECFDQAVTVGQAYMLKLVHLVDDKIHARSTGPYSLVTQQPLRGRSKQGGQRLGEMEVWALEGFGAAYILQELLTVKSDDMKGRHQVMDALLNNKPISLGTPESFKVLIRELQCLCLDAGVYTVEYNGPRKQIDAMTYY